MKWILYSLVGVVLFVVVFADRLFSGTGATGVITKIQQETNGPIATEIASVQLPDKMVQATIYETQIPYLVGDDVLLAPDGETPGAYTIADFMRVPALVRIFGIFLIVVIVAAGWAGFRSLAGLYISFAILFSFVLPQIAAGADPLAVTLFASFGIRQEPLGAVAQQGVALFGVKFLADYKHACARSTLKNVGDQCRHGGRGSVSIHDVQIGFRERQTAQLGGQNRLQLAHNRLVA